MLRIGPDFVEPVDDDVPTDKGRRLHFSDDESEEDFGDDLDLGDDDVDAAMDGM